MSDHDPDLVAYWKFDEGKGDLVKDSTGHGHDLYLTGEPRWQVGHQGILQEDYLWLCLLWHVMPA